MISVKKKSYAKVNLFLNIIRKRNDGYHDLQSIFQTITLRDNLTFIKAKKTELLIKNNTDYPLKNNADNLVIKTIEKLKPYLTKKRNIKIILEKNIPIGAGLGGGSSNCACVLQTLNHLWNLNLSHKKLKKIALSLGADVYFFLKEKIALVEGIGEKITKISLKKQYFVLIKPNVFCSTKELYNHKDLKLSQKKFAIDDKFMNLPNSFEKIAKEMHPNIEKSLKLLLEYAPAKMSGSGSCVFASFFNKKKATKCYIDLKKQLVANKEIFFCQSL